MRSSEFLPPVALVVEDDRVLRTLVAGVLRRRLGGHEVHECEDGPAALASVRTFVEQGRELSLCVTDLVMPGVDGLEVLACVRELAPDCARVVLTGHAGVQSALETLRAGHDDYLQKPFREDELVRVLAGHVARKAADRRARRAEARLLVSFRSFARVLDAVHDRVDPHLEAILRRPEIGEGHRKAMLDGRRELQHVAVAYRHLVSSGTTPPGAAEPVSLREVLEASVRAACASHGSTADAVTILEARVPSQALLARDHLRIALTHLIDNALRSGTGRAQAAILGEGRNWPGGWSAEDLSAAVRQDLSEGHVGIAISNTAALTREDERYVRAVLDDDLRDDEPLRGVGLWIARLYAELLGGKLIFQWRPKRSEVVMTLLVPRGDTGVQGAPESW